MKKLRTRLILSHILPLLVIVPLVSLALIYVLETQVVLVGLSQELEEQAAIIGELAGEETAIWSDPDQAQNLVARINRKITARITLLDINGRILASSKADKVGQRIDPAVLETALAGQSIIWVNYSQVLHVEVVDVLVPIKNADQQVVGLIRLTHQLASIYERFLNLRFLIGRVALVELGMGAAFGFILALNLERYLERVRQSLYNIMSGQPLPPLPKGGPEEVQALFQAVSTLSERLNTLEDARRRLLANLVHELGRPLGALRSAVHALLHGADHEPELRLELLYGMEAEILQLQPLLENLAQLHGQVLGSLELDRRPVAISRWLPTVARPWQAAAEEKGLSWWLDVPVGLPTLSLDSNQMARVIGNLLSNAVKYTPGGGQVSIEAGVSDDALTIDVSDTGVGILSEELEHIFEPFHRSQPDRRFPQGIGLGLTIARDIVTAHGGQLLVESTPDQGSRFTIRLPLEAENLPRSSA